jgi:hydrogenase expression/formation protein HypD
MEVCGGHTASIHRFAIPSLLPANIRLISGPGCPVCVTGAGFIDRLVSLARTAGIIIATFGDLIRIPGSESSLEKERQSGADIRIVFSGLDALDIARKNRDRKIIFPGIGFETTAPGTAATIIQAAKSGIENFFVLSAHKIMPPALERVAADNTGISGFILPGHVAAVTGSSYFDFIAERYGIAGVVTGFEPADILQSVRMLVQQVNDEKPRIEIQYSRAVTNKGNTRAMNLMYEVFELCNSNWRGLGVVKAGGLKIKDRFSRYDAATLFKEEIIDPAENEKCICGDILRGRSKPSECSLFGVVCTPSNPVGACMVSGEGSCNTYYKYGRNEQQD